MNYLVYDELTGLILRTGSCPQDDVELQPSGINERVISGVSVLDSVNYVDVVTETVKPRPTFAASIDKTLVAADGIDFCTIQGLPAQPITVYVNDVEQPEEVLDGSAEVTFDLMGTYTIRLSSFPYLDYEVTVNAY